MQNRIQVIDSETSPEQRIVEYIRLVNQLNAEVTTLVTVHDCNLELNIETSTEFVESCKRLRVQFLRTTMSQVQALAKEYDLKTELYFAQMRMRGEFLLSEPT